MKKYSVMAAIVLFLAVGCHKKKPGTETQIITDTIYGPDSSWVIEGPIPDTLIVPDTRAIDSLTDVIRSKDSALFESNFKLARIWYYDSLCLKNSRLDKYLKGWIRRALEK